MKEREPNDLFLLFLEPPGIFEYFDYILITTELTRLILLIHIKTTEKRLVNINNTSIVNWNCTPAEHVW